MDVGFFDNVLQCWLEAWHVFQKVRDAVTVFPYRTQPDAGNDFRLQFAFQQMHHQLLDATFELTLLCARQTLELLDDVFQVKPIELFGAQQFYLRAGPDEKVRFVVRVDVIVHVAPSLTVDSRDRILVGV